MPIMNHYKVILTIKNYLYYNCSNFMDDIIIIYNTCNKNLYPIKESCCNKLLYNNSLYNGIGYEQCFNNDLHYNIESYKYYCDLDPDHVNNEENNKVAHVTLYVFISICMIMCVSVIIYKLCINICS